MFTKSVKQGTRNPNTATVGPHPIEVAVIAKHVPAGLDFLRQHDDGSYDLVMPSAEHYADAMDEITSSSEDHAVVSDVLRRHSA
jgi:hypothetical protein